MKVCQQIQAMFCSRQYQTTSRLSQQNEKSTSILEYLQSRKYCETIMDDLLLFTPSKKSHIAKLQDLFKALLKMDLRFHQRNFSYLEESYSMWETQYSCRIGEFVLSH